MSIRHLLACAALAFAACRSTISPPYRFTVETYDVPLEVGAELYRAPDASRSTVAVLLDEWGKRDALHELSHSRADVVRNARAPIVLGEGEKGRVPARTAGASDAADALQVDLGARASDWAACEVDFAVSWTAPGGELCKVAGSTPLPSDHALQIVCLPYANAPAARAVFAFVVVDETHEHHPH